MAAPAPATAATIVAGLARHLRADRVSPNQWGGADAAVGDLVARAYPIDRDESAGWTVHAIDGGALLRTVELRGPGFTANQIAIAACLALGNYAGAE